MTTTIDYSMLIYPSDVINREFRIKVSGFDNDGRKINTLVGVWGLMELMADDIELLNRILKKAMATMKYSYTKRLRRGLKITFYIK